MLWFYSEEAHQFVLQKIENCGIFGFDLSKRKWPIKCLSNVEYPLGKELVNKTFQMGSNVRFYTNSISNATTGSNTDLFVAFEMEFV